MGYCTLADVRAEGLPVSVADNARVLDLIEKQSAVIDRVTGWWFEPRALTMKLDGRDTPFLHLAAPAIEVTEVRRVWRGTDPDTTYVIDSDDYVVYSYDLPGHRFNPHLRLISSADNALVLAAGMATETWVKGALNYEVDGTFGFLEDDGAGGYQTPSEITEACILLVLHNATPKWDQLSGNDLAYSLRTGDLRSHQVQGRSASWGGSTSAGSATGLKEADRILAKYRSQIGVAVA